MIAPLKVALFNKNIRADKELKNLSANQLKSKGHKGITLLERLLLEILYFDRTKKHLDINNVTLFSGSRDSVGRIPYVHWYSELDLLFVLWLSPDDAHDCLRSRAVVS